LVGWVKEGNPKETQDEKKSSCVFNRYRDYLFLCRGLERLYDILATKRATRDGSVIVSHSDDDELDDQRIIYVSAEEVGYPE